MERCFFGVSTGVGSVDGTNRNRCIQNLDVNNCIFTDMDGFGVGIGNVDYGSVTNCKFLHNGISYIWCGSASAMLQMCNHFTFSNNEIADTYKNPLHLDGCGLDLEGYNDNITIDGNLIHDSYGNAIMLYDNGSSYGGNGYNNNITICNNVLYNDCANFSQYTNPSEIAFDSSTAQLVTSFGNTIYTRNGGKYSPSLIGGTFSIDYFNIGSSEEWNFNTDGNTEGWYSARGVSNLTASNGYLEGTISDTDPHVGSEDNLGIDITNNKTLTIRFRTTVPSAANTGTACVYFITESDTTYDVAKSKTFAIKLNDSGYTEYTIDMSDISGWTGALKQLRFDVIEFTGGDTTNAVSAYGGYGSKSLASCSDTLTTIDETNGTNLALSATSSASSNSSTAVNVTDDSISTVWTATSAVNEWVELDFASALEINKFIIKQAGNSSINKYAVQYWDGSSWQDVFNGYTEMGSIKQMPVIPISTQKVRLYIYSTESGTPSIMEFGVYNVSRSGALSWEFSANGYTQNWIAGHNISDLIAGSGYLNGTITGSDPSMGVGNNLDINITNNKIIKIRYKNSTSDTSASFYFTTNADTTYDETQKVTFTVNANDPNYTEYTIDMSNVPSWTGNLRRFRFDPADNATNGTFSIDYIRIPSDSIAWEYNTNGNADGWIIGHSISNLTASNGYLDGSITGSDPSMGAGDNLGINITYNKTIKIRYKNSTSDTSASFYFTTSMDTAFDETKKVTFTVNANDPNYSEYIIDMSNVSGWTGTLKQLRFDPTENASSGTFSIDYIKIPDDSIRWDYTVNGDTEGWAVGHNVSSLTVSNGYMSGTITGSDPNLVSSNNLGINITYSNNQIVKIRMRNSTSDTTASLYYITNADTTYDETKKVTFSIIANDSDYTEYTIDMSNVSAWTETLKQIRLDPTDNVASGSFSIDYMYIE